MADIPQVLREIPPEKFRELIDTLLGAPLQHQSSSLRREILDDSSHEQREQPHTKLAGGRIATHRHRSEIYFRTKWQELTGLRPGLDSEVRMMYLGAATDSRYRSDGEIRQCKDAWAHLLQTGQTATFGEWFKKKATRIGISFGIKELIEWIWEQ